MGTRTQEYQVFQSNFSRLVNAVSADVEAVALKSFAKNLISSNNLSAAGNKYHPEYARASTLMSQIHSKIDERKNNFHVFMAILQSIPTLRSLGNDLIKKAGGSQVPDSTPSRSSPPTSSDSNASNSAVPRTDNSRTSGEPRTGNTASGTATEPIARPNLSVKESLRMTISLAGEWQNIGILLGLDDGTLSTIRANYPQQATNCLREMLIVWLRQVDPRPSWAVLADAVEPFDPSKAKEIRDKCL